MARIDPERLVDLAAAAAWEVKANSPIILDLREICSFADHLLICSAETDRQVRAIADHIGACLGKLNIWSHHQEGYAEAKWILLDYLYLIIHILDEKTRRYYDLERLWADAPQREYRR